MPERVHIPGLRGKCDVCKGSYLVRDDGKLRYHGPHNKPCEGSGSQPSAVRGPGAKWEAADGG